MDKAMLTTLCWALFALLVIIFWVPALIAKLGGTRFVYLGPSNVPDPDPLEREPDYEFWASQLRDLDYELVGDVRLQMDFVGNQWRINSWHRLFYSSAKSTYVLLQKFPDPFNIWRGIEFVTLLSDDGFLVTKNLTPQLFPEDLSIVLQGDDTFVLEDLEKLHLTMAEELRRKGRRPEPEPTVEHLLRSMERLENQTAKFESERLAGRFLSVNFIIHVAVSIPLAYAVSFGHWLLALTNLILLIIMQFGESLQNRQTAFIMRESIRQVLTRR